MNEVCRLCLADTTSCDENTSYDEKIQLLMPEIDLNITPTVILCEDCSDTLNNAYTFKQNCLQNEECIKNYIYKTQTPLTNLRCVTDQSYNDNKESLDEVNVNIKDEYDNCDNNSITNWANVDYKDIHSINEEYHLTFPKEEIVQQYKDECASNRCKEEIIETKETESLEIFLCEICKESFKTSVELDLHCPIHLNEGIFHCDLCNKKFSKKGYLTRHMLTHSDNSIRNFCDICNKGFRWKKNLDKHKDTHNNKTYTCPFCSKSCRHLRSHIRNTHFKRHICKICNKEYGTKLNLIQHMLKHTGERPYKCEICDKNFSIKRSLAMHMRIHQLPEVEKLFICNVASCNSRFKTKKCLYQHMDRHRTWNKHQCNLCDRSFHFPSLLKHHMRSHTGERPYKCDTCHKTFARKDVMKKHVKSHRSKEI